MKTEISKFCEAYLTVLNALPPAMKDATAAMEKGDAAGLLQRPLATLNDTRARLRSLVEKLESQQAYLLIFGPLKSGKSTLMNAISRSYVSEVTSLPGYPCLVYVRHAEKPYFSATRYNGRESIFANGQILKDIIADSHIALAEQIREAEARHGEFDPRHDFSEAIRRVDVKLPVETLAESSTVLVDTPGLYSRMNFGYDVLTREFRDSAACAVFVVKTDNLYLEQVFNEFNQLLGLFSRIFLVINVDSNKRDLQPDGTLEPSAESRNPQQIIEAFKTLSMAGPLRQAYEDGRVRIHAVDLLHAASSYLAGSASLISNGTNGADKTNGTDKTNGNTASNGNGHAPADPTQRDAFDTFLGDLTDYLNSSDYTQEFLRDSLRQGNTLCGEMREVCAGPEIKEIAEKQAALAGEMKDLQEKIATTDRLLSVNWEGTFDLVRAENAKAIDRHARERAETLTKEMGTALDEWYGADASLHDLTARHWNPLLATAARDVAAETRTRLRELLGGRLGGAEPAASVMTDLHAIEFPLSPVAEAAAPALDAPETGDAYHMAIKAEHVPVKKSFGDWMLFRGIATVRRRLFGEDLQQTIAPEIKTKRLSEPTRAAFLEMTTATVKERFPELPAKFAQTLAASYAAAFQKDIRERLGRKRDEFAGSLAERQAPYDTITAILGAMKNLDEHSSQAVAEIILMAQQETGISLDLAGAAPATQAEPAAERAPDEYSAA